MEAEQRLWQGIRSIPDQCWPLRFGASAAKLREIGATENPSLQRNEPASTGELGRLVLKFKPKQPTSKGLKKTGNGPRQGVKMKNTNR